MQVATFSWLDYFFFALMLSSSALVGVYYGFFQKQNTANEYLLGNKRMTVWPTAMSIVSSTLSGFTLLSVPADVYKYGVAYGIIIVGCIIMGITSYFFLPVFYKLQITSVYEYLGIRFNNKVRILGSLLYAIYMILYLPIVIYIPALALGQVTSLNVHLITPIVCVVCIFYTTLGGLKAVVWTDTIQFGIMFGAIMVIITVGLWNEGGLQNVLQNALTGGRLDISFDLSLVKRETFWAIIIGQTCQQMSYFSVGQGPVQKFMALPSLKAINVTLILATTGISLIVFLSVFSGLLMYSAYANCDPLAANSIKSDQILPFYVMQQINIIPGLGGLFISGVFSAGLSTLSAVLNCLAAIIFEDFISPFIHKDTSKERIGVYLKVIVLIVGVISTALVYVVEKLGGLAALTLAFAGVTSGPILGLFVLGMLMPKVTSKGALAGGISSLCVMAWLIISTQWYKTKGLITYPSLPLSIEGCNGSSINTNATLVSIIELIPTNLEEPHAIYKISFYWYAAIGFVVTVVVAVVVSCFTKQDKPLNKDCISPVNQLLTANTKSQRYDQIAATENL